MVIYRNVLDGTEHVVLTKGKIAPDKPTLVRMHRVDMAADMLGHVEARRDYVPKALQAIAAYDGAGVAVFIRDSNPAWLSERYGQPEINQTANVLRDYGGGCADPDRSGRSRHAAADRVEDRAAGLDRLRAADSGPRTARLNRGGLGPFGRSPKVAKRALVAAGGSA